jgi:crossover junction endodeoxyribonuclease RuvC
MTKSRTRGSGEEASTWIRHLTEVRRAVADGALFHYVGIDLSLRSTGLHAGTGDPKCADGRSRVVETPEHLRGQRRLDFIADGVLSFMEELRAAIVLFEAPSFGSGDRAHAKGALHGVIRRELWLRGQWIASVPPATLKVFAAGKGNAKKPEIAVDVYMRWRFRSDCDDVTDAFACSRLAAAFVHPEGALSHWKRAIDKVQLELPRVVAGGPSW